jgi:DNA-binding GntR family transcriptional regulator
MQFEPLSVTKTTVEYLRTKIIRGELVGGQKLNEIQLSTELRISRPPIREAFRILEHEHVIVRVPRIGVFVSDANMEDCEDVYCFREMFECHAVDLLKARGISELPRVSLALEKAAGLSMPPEQDKDQRFNYLRVFSEFHIQMVEAAGNSRLAYFYRSIQATLWRFQFMYLSIPGTGSSSIQEHREILGAINRGEYDLAKRHLADHIHQTLVLLKKQVQERIS